MKNLILLSFVVLLASCASHKECTHDKKDCQTKCEKKCEKTADKTCTKTAEKSCCTKK